MKLIKTLTAVFAIPALVFFMSACGGDDHDHGEDEGHADHDHP